MPAPAQGHAGGGPLGRAVAAAREPAQDAARVVGGGSSRKRGGGGAEQSVDWTGWEGGGQPGGRGGVWGDARILRWPHACGFSPLMAARRRTS